MPPTVILIRHAQALHNDYTIPDPPLSELGIQQCAPLRESLRARLAGARSVAVISSPMRRTLQTALLSADWLLDRARIEVDPEWQENSDKPCDTGSPLPAILDAFPQTALDFSAVAASPWPDKTSPLARNFANSRAAILARAGRALHALRRRGEDYVLVFSHGGFLREALTGWWFSNADYRVFEIVDPSDTLPDGDDGDHDDDDDDDGQEEDVYRDLVGEERDRLRLRQKGTRSGGLGKSLMERARLGAGLPEHADAAARL
ncbi:putative phosphatase [Escovopsis weberi]|uniref:Putative phosphatase n=1 Tax=Escovopsis weberi TaxID=150374 RepID=A0A0M8N3U0_ESCWE|nr:putative phosphatase [Escovopsis weberi]